MLWLLYTLKLQRAKQLGPKLVLMSFLTNFKSKSFVEKNKTSDHYTEGLELIKSEKSSESVQILRRNWNKLDDDHLLVELNCFLQKKFESMSGQLLTSDTNRCAEIVHEKLVEALNTFYL